MPRPRSGGGGVYGSSGSFTQFRNALKREGKRVTAARMDRLGERAVRYAREIAVEEGLGRRDLERSIRRLEPWPFHYVDSFQFEEPVDTGSTIRLRLYNGHPAALWVEAGTEPHMIPAKKNKVMHGRRTYFTQWPEAPYRRVGPPVRTNIGYQVPHPGTKAYRILDRAVRRAVAEQRNFPKRAFR